MDVNKNPQKS